MTDKNSLSITKEEKLKALVNPEYTGNVITSANKFPPVINILQSDKQYTAFKEYQDQDATGIVDLVKGKGKLFIRKQEGNSTKDLVDVIDGIVLKIQMGHEVYSFDDSGTRKLIGSDSFLIPAKGKEQWIMDHPNQEYKNMVKVILSPNKSVKEIRELIAKGINPFCMLTIKGGGWGTWFEAQKKMNVLTMASDLYSHKSASDLLVSVFKFSVSSKAQQGSQSTYYVPEITVGLNEPDVAYDFSDFVVELKDINLFYKVAESIESTETVVTQNISDIDDILG